MPFPYTRPWAGALVCATLGLGLLSGPVAAAADAQKITMTLDDYRFKPDVVRVVAGRPVALELVNRDWFIPHNLTLESAPAQLHLDVDLSPLTSTTVTFTPQVPGTYGFYCDEQFLWLKSHRARGMVGELIVQPSGSAQ